MTKVDFEFSVHDSWRDGLNGTSLYLQDQSNKVKELLLSSSNFTKGEKHPVNGTLTKPIECGMYSLVCQDGKYHHEISIQTKKGKIFSCDDSIDILCSSPSLGCDLYVTKMDERLNVPVHETCLTGECKSLYKSNVPSNQSILVHKFNVQDKVTTQKKLKKCSLPDPGCTADNPIRGNKLVDPRSDVGDGDAKFCYNTKACTLPTWNNGDAYSKEEIKVGVVKDRNECYLRGVEARADAVTYSDTTKECYVEKGVDFTTANWYMSSDSWKTARINITKPECTREEYVPPDYGYYTCEKTCRENDSCDGFYVRPDRSCKYIFDENLWSIVDNEWKKSQCGSYDENMYYKKEAKSTARYLCAKPYVWTPRLETFNKQGDTSTFSYAECQMLRNKPKVLWKQFGINFDESNSMDKKSKYYLTTDPEKKERFNFDCKWFDEVQRIAPHLNPKQVFFPKVRCTMDVPPNHRVMYLSYNDDYKEGLDDYWYSTTYNGEEGERTLGMNGPARYYLENYFNGANSVETFKKSNSDDQPLKCKEDGKMDDDFQCKPCDKEDETSGCVKRNKYLHEDARIVQLVDAYGDSNNRKEEIKRFKQGRLLKSRSVIIDPCFKHDTQETCTNEPNDYKCYWDDSTTGFSKHLDHVRCSSWPLGWFRNNLTGGGREQNYIDKYLPVVNDDTIPKGCVVHPRKIYDVSSYRKTEDNRYIAESRPDPTKPKIPIVEIVWNESETSSAVCDHRNAYDHFPGGEKPFSICMTPQDLFCGRGVLNNMDKKSHTPLLCRGNVHGCTFDEKDPFIQTGIQEFWRNGRPWSREPNESLFSKDAFDYIGSWWHLSRLFLHWFDKTYRSDKKKIRSRGRNVYFRWSEEPCDTHRAFTVDVRAIESKQEHGMTFFEPFESLDQVPWRDILHNPSCQVPNKKTIQEQLISGLGESSGMRMYNWAYKPPLSKEQVETYKKGYRYEPVLNFYYPTLRHELGLKHLRDSGLFSEWELVQKVRTMEYGSKDLQLWHKIRPSKLVNTTVVGSENTCKQLAMKTKDVSHYRTYKCERVHEDTCCKKPEHSTWTNASGCESTCNEGYYKSGNTCKEVLRTCHLYDGNIDRDQVDNKEEKQKLTSMCQKEENIPGSDWRTTRQQLCHYLKYKPEESSVQCPEGTEASDRLLNVHHGYRIKNGKKKAVAVHKNNLVCLPNLIKEIHNNKHHYFENTREERNPRLSASLKAKADLPKRFCDFFNKMINSFPDEYKRSHSKDLDSDSCKEVRKGILRKPTNKEKLQVKVREEMGFALAQLEEYKVKDRENICDLDQHCSYYPTYPSCPNMYKPEDPPCKLGVLYAADIVPGLFYKGGRPWGGLYKTTGTWEPDPNPERGVLGGFKYNKEDDEIYQQAFHQWCQQYIGEMVNEKKVMATASSHLHLDCKLFAAEIPVDQTHKNSPVQVEPISTHIFAGDVLPMGKKIGTYKAVDQDHCVRIGAQHGAVFTRLEG